MPPGRLRFGLKVAQMGGTYAQIRDAWLEADRLGFDTAWAHDHMLNQNDQSRHEDEGWTILTALGRLEPRPEHAVEDARVLRLAREHLERRGG